MRLFRAGFVLAREGAFSIVDTRALPPALRSAVGLARLLERRAVRRRGPEERLRAALDRLGPTYVKIGQALATRPDIVGAQVAGHLALLQDKMAPFDADLVPGLLAAALHERAAELAELTPPIAAASIAQVHRAVLATPAGPLAVAVKILRPGIKARFRADLETQFAAAALAERWVKPLRRLRPTDVVRTLERSARLELDLRLEAAAISEMAGNIKDDEGFIIPQVSWDHTTDTVLTTSWVDGIPIRELDAIAAAGLDRRELARLVLQSFLRHAIRDGFFHADMHPGNLFADPAGRGIVAVDFGIMGRLTRRERRFLADILYGFITRDYRLIAERHFEIGYVPRHQSIDDFALALRAIGEPLQGRRATEISMARVLGQLFATTEMFDMQTRPELLLLQKSMVLVEGVSRMLDPELDIWTLAEPVVGAFVRREAGPLGRLEDWRDRAGVATETLGRLPGLVRRAETALDAYAAGRRAPSHAGRHLLLAVLFGVVLGVALIGLIRLLA